MWATLVKAKAPSCAWCHQATMSDPHVAVKVYAHFPANDGHVWEEAELTGTGWREKVERLRTLRSVQDLAILESTPEHARIRLRVDQCPLPFAVAASGLLPRFPFEIRSGHDQWLLIGEREAGARFIRELQDRNVDVEVLSTKEYHPQANLTPRQRELMDIAIDQGYYEVPRRVTLTKLAERVHISKSTLSEALARAEKHVLEDLRGGGP